MRIELDEISDTREPADLVTISDFESRWMVTIPSAHKDILLQSNGFSFYSGIFRMFSVEEIDRWNQIDYWKFAWKVDLGDYLTIFETAFGEQYTYRLSDLRAGGSPIYELDGVSMKAERIHETFEDFFENEVLRNLSSPYDSLILDAARKYSKVPLNQHIIHTPSILISDQEDIEETQLMESRTAMIINGDLYTQLADEAYDRVLDRIDFFQDERGNDRARVIWAE